jgi:hypothetical protein
MKETFHSSFFETNVGKYANGNRPSVNPFVKDLNGGALWTLLDTYNSEAGRREDGILDLARRLADYNLELGTNTGYPAPHGMVAKALVGCDDKLSLGVHPTADGLNIVLVGAGEHVDNAIESWPLPLGDGIPAIDAALDQIVHEVSQKIRPNIARSISP